MEKIKEILSEKEMRNSVEIIKTSFTTVAKEFNLTKKNSPTHPSFFTFDKLQKMIEKGVKFFGFYKDDKAVGIIAIEKASESLYYLEKLAVLPEFRDKGYGEKLVAFLFNYVKKNKGEKISIGIIDENTVLKNCPA